MPKKKIQILRLFAVRSLKLNRKLTVGRGFYADVRDAYILQSLVCSFATVSLSFDFLLNVHIFWIWALTKIYRREFFLTYLVYVTFWVIHQHHIDKAIYWTQLYVLRWIVLISCEIVFTVSKRACVCLMCSSNLIQYASHRKLVQSLNAS